jgi:uroporphyrinogen-III synthase
MSEGRGRIVLTGAPGSFGGVGGSPGLEGLEVVEAPLIEFAPAESSASLDRALHRLASFGGIALTSPRAAAALVDAINRLGIDPAALPPVWTGAASLAPLRAVCPVVRTPEAPASGPSSLGLNLAATMIAEGVRGPILFPCGEVHREELIIRLRAAGCRVEPVVVYRAVLASRDAMAKAVRQATVVVVTSPRVAELLAAAVPAGRRPLLVAIGPTTARHAARSGWAPDAVAATPETTAIAGAISSLLPSVL